MIDFPPEHASRDEVLEWCARLIEGRQLTDFIGIGARKKRDREDASLRYRTMQEARAEFAKHIRAFKERSDLDALPTLRHLANLGEEDRHDAYLTEAWPLAWKGWLDIAVTVLLTNSSVPPDTVYRITVTEEGRRALDAASPSASSP